MSSTARRVFFGDFVFFVDENVYKPAEDTFLFAESLQVRENGTVLDLGSGCGILSILAAQKARSVLAVDVNPYAIRCTRRNAVSNGVSERVSCIQGDLFSAIKRSTKLGLILFNAPYLPTPKGESGSWVALSWDGGASGRVVIDRFIGEAGDYLEEDGSILLMQSSLVGLDETFRRFEECNMTAKALAQRRLPFFETLLLIEARLT